MRCLVYAALPVMKTEVFARVPVSLRARENTRKQSGAVRDCFPEGETGTILSATLEAPGKEMYSHV